MNDLGWLHKAGVGIFFSIPAALLFLAGFLAPRSSRLKMRSWTTARGTVIGYKEVQQGRHYDAQGKRDDRPAGNSPFPSKLCAYDPQVQFASADGKMVTFTSSMGSNRKPYRIGATVQVLYAPDNPENAAIKSFSTLYLPAFFAFLFGAVILGIGLYLLSW